MKVFDNIYKINSGYTDYNIINQHTSPSITIKRLVGENLIEKVTFSEKDIDSLLSYSYSRSLDDISGKFTIRFKDVIQEANENSGKINGSIYDNLLPFDIIYIKRNLNQKDVDFIGILHSKQISASIGSDGKVHKEVSISGSSILSIYNDFYINLSVIGTTATSTDAANFNLKNTFFTVDKNNNQISLKAKKMDEVVLSIWEDFKNYAGNLCNVSNIDLLKIIAKLNLSIECQNIDCKYPIATNLYNNGEIRFISMLQALFPTGAYEMYEENTKLKIREVPFRKKDWKELDKVHCYEINPTRLIEYDFTQSDSEVYTVFMADVEGLKEIDTSYNHAKRSATSKGFIRVQENKENVRKYGYRLCNISFLGYTQNPNIKEENIFDQLNLDLKEMYENVHNMFNGRIKVVDSETSPTIGEKINFSIKYKGNEQTTSFYINSENHSWSNGSTPTVDYTISRGAVYDMSGKFEKTPVGFTTSLESEILKG